MLAAVAGRLLSGASLDVELRWIEGEVASALAIGSARIELSATPSPRPGETAVHLPLKTRAGWLYVPDGADAQRIAEPLGRLIDLALERERIGAQVAEAESARRADVVKTAVLHAISHDLRTPLTAITTAGDALAQPGTSEAERSELVGVVREESHRLARMVSDLLDLSRIEAGAVEPRRDWIDLRDVVARAIEGVRAMHPDAVIAFELPEDLPLVRADAAQLERVFANLLENAVKFSAPGAAVQVRGGTGGGRVNVRVIDHGPGIPPGQRARVFEPFVRLGGGRGGAGLGLAISRGFVEANGGRIVVQSGPEGGAAFAVSLPLAPSPAPVG
jgi:two-component system sensor histidine kinase KdpD